MACKMYNRQKVYEYAKKWAYGRNPKYYNKGEITSIDNLKVGDVIQLSFNGNTFSHSLIMVWKNIDVFILYN